MQLQNACLFALSDSPCSVAWGCVCMQASWLVWLFLGHCMLLLVQVARQELLPWDTCRRALMTAVHFSDEMCFWWEQVGYVSFLFCTVVLSARNDTGLPRSLSAQFRFCYTETFCVSLALTCKSSAIYATTWSKVNCFCTSPFIFGSLRDTEPSLLKNVLWNVSWGVLLSHYKICLWTLFSLYFCSTVWWTVCDCKWMCREHYPKEACAMVIMELTCMRFHNLAALNL